VASAPVGAQNGISELRDADRAAEIEKARASGSPPCKRSCTLYGVRFLRGPREVHSQRITLTHEPPRRY